MHGADTGVITHRQTDAMPSPAPVLLGWVAGTARQLQQAVLPSPAACVLWLAAAVALAAVAAMLGRRHAGATAGGAKLAWALAAALLAFGVCSSRAALFAAGALAPPLEGRELQVEGIVDAMPQQGPAGTRLRFEAAQAFWRGEPVDVPAQLSLGWWTGEGGVAAPPFVPGERWRLTVRLKAPHGLLNPHGFDTELWLWEQGLQASGSIAAATRLEAAGWRRPVERARQAVRDAIVARVDEARSAGVVAALVTGDQSAIGRADWELFRETGVAHLMSISGLHVTLFAWIAAAVAARAWRRSARLCLACPAQHAALVAGVLLAAAYAVFSGWGVPSQRTVLMLATVALLRLAGRRWPWPQVWLLAAAVVLAADPWALLQPGFWLSFVAVGVLFATDAGMAGARLEAAPDRAGVHRALHSLAALLREQVVITAALAPLTLLLFQQVSLVGLLANLMAIPWVTLVVTPLAMLGVAVPALWNASALAVQALGWLLEHLAAWPLATLSRPAVAPGLGAAAVVGGVLLVMRLPWRLRLLGLPLVLPALLWQPPRPGEGRFDVMAADVGQGNAVLVRTRHHALHYDSGPRWSADNDAGGRVLVPLLRALGERPDLLVLSHRDSDHTGGAASVLAAQPGLPVLASLEPGHPLRALAPTRDCEAGQAWTWDGVRFEVLHPPPGQGEAVKPNARSCVLRVVAADGAAALLTGDIERAQESALVEAGVPLAADFLLAPHHGSGTSSSAGFIDAVAPAVAVVQAGYRNRFGHPAAAVLERYAAAGVPVVGTPGCGALRWRSQAPGQWLCTRDERRRYWHHVQTDAAAAGR